MMLVFTTTLLKRNPSCLTYIELEGLSLQESIESGQLRIGRGSFGQMNPHFEVGKSSRQILVRRKSDERYKLDCLTPTFKSGRISIMIWGGFTGTHKLICLQIDALLLIMSRLCMMGYWVHF
jgi:hypothetical protein